MIMSYAVEAMDGGKRKNLFLFQAEESFGGKGFLTAGNGFL